MRTIMAAALVAAAAAPAGAQTPFQPASQGRGFISANGIYETTSSAFTDRVEFQDFVEAGSIETRFETKQAFGVDGTIGIRLWRGIGAAVGFSTYAPGSQNDAGGEVTARLPHPFEFERHREVSGAAGLRRKETAIHASLLYFIPVNDRLQAVIGAGPTFFQAEQSFVDRVQYDHVYPYDTATFRGVNRDNESASGVGFNASLDLTWRLTRHFGAGGIIRYARASLPFTPGERTITVDVGGLRAGLGVRVLF